MGVLEETKIIQAINRFEDTRLLLNDVGRNDPRFTKRFNEMIEEMKKFESELAEIRDRMNIENLGKHDHDRNF